MSSPGGLRLAIAFLTVFGCTAQKRAPDTTFDIPYTDPAVPEQQLDFYAPAAARFPTLVFVHGGGLTGDWPAGRKGAPYPAMARAFQQAGVAMAVISYRLGPTNAWPAQPEDVAAAFAWVKKHVAARGGDPSRVFLMGHSSGGHLVGAVGDDPKYLAKFGLTLKNVAGVIPMGSLLDFQLVLDQYTPQLRERLFRSNGFFQTFRTADAMLDAGPTQHISRTMPRYLIMMGEYEQENPPLLVDAKAFVEKTKEAGGQASYIVIPERTHLQVLEHMTGPDDPAMQAILKFIQTL